MTDDEKAAALVARVRADPFYRWDAPVDEAMRRAHHALRVKGMLVEALTSVVTLMVDCPRDGTTAPAGDCDCDTCATFREVSAALAEARKTP
jgi:hypothetical protein